MMLHAVRVPRCPHCEMPLQPLRYGVPFGPIAIRIIDTIAQAGSRGIDRNDLRRSVYHDRNGTDDALKSYIGSINSALIRTEIAIRCDRAIYRISRRPRV